MFAETLEKILSTPLGRTLSHVAEPFVECVEWPDVSTYMLPARTKESRPCSGAGVPLEFVPERLPSRKKLGFERLYEPRIFVSGQVSTRPHHWHDFFNMLVWHSFPKTKAALNRRHFLAFDERAPFPWKTPVQARTPEQDALTIFDEGGMIVLCSDLKLWKMVRDESFDVVFKKMQPSILASMRFFVFGHAVYEEMVKEHWNVVASALVVPCDETTLNSDLISQINFADEHAAGVIGNRNQPLFTKSFVGVPVELLLREQEKTCREARMQKV